MKRFFAIVVMVAAVVVLCTTAGFAAKKTAKPYVIGAIFSVTGDNAPLGVPERQTVEMLAKQINAKGGIDGHPVKVEFYDDAGKPDQAAQACSRLLDNKDVVAIIGPTLTGPSLAIATMCENAGMPLVSCAASIKIVSPVKPYVLKTAQSDSLVARRLVKYLQSKKIKSVGFIYDSNAFGSSGRDQWIRATKDSGIETVGMESFGTGDTDMTSQLTRLRSKNPQAIVCWGTNPGPAIVAKNLRTLGMKTPLFMSHGVANMEFIRLAGVAADGVVFPGGKLLVADKISSGDPQRKILQKYAADYTKTYGKGPNTFGGHAWDAFMITVRALEQSGGDRAKTRAALEATKKFVGISGVFNMSPRDHNGLSMDCLSMIRIKDGKWTIAK
jgi:branched-chain amino acid transport system substrate-binding protein